MQFTLTQRLRALQKCHARYIGYMHSGRNSAGILSLIKQTNDELRATAALIIAGENFGWTN